MLNLNTYYYRKACSITCAVLVAMIVARYISFSHEVWMAIAALIASQTTRGTPIKQSIYFAYIMILGVIFAEILVSNLAPILLQVTAASLFVVAAMVLFYYRPLQESIYLYIILFPLTVLIATLMHHYPEAMLYQRIIDILLGTVIAIICQQTINPVQPYKDLTLSLLPILDAFAMYTMALQDYLLTNNENHLQNKRNSIELALQSSGEFYPEWISEQYPEWIFEAGYNPGLRSGYRYFVLNIEKISELLFSIDYLIGAGIKAYIPDQMRIYFADVCKNNAELLRILKLKLAAQDIAYSDANFVGDMNELETELHRQMPGGLELLSFTQENIQVTSLVRDMKDMRAILTQLLLVLPER